MNTELKPLWRAKNMINDVDLEVTYEYDDLVFVKNNPFLLRFDLEDVSKIYVHFNVDCESDAVESLSKVLEISAQTNELELLVDKKYKMTPNEAQNDIQIQFI